MGRDDVQFGRWVPTFCGHALSPFSSIFMVTEDEAMRSFKTLPHIRQTAGVAFLEYRNVHGLVLPPQVMAATDTSDIHKFYTLFFYLILGLPTS